MTKVLSPVACLVVLLCAAGGCAGVRPSCQVPSTVELEIESSDRVNRDEKGRSLPTVVRLYQLTDLSVLQTSTFEDVWERDEETLGDTRSTGPKELTIYPGQIMVERFKRDPAADFLVAVAVFRRPVGGAWRTIEEWPLPGDPCAEQDDEDAAPKLEQLRVRMFLQDYRIASTNNYRALPKRSCPPGQAACAGTSGSAPDELPEALRGRRLRTFEEDASPAQPTVGSEAGDEGGGAGGGPGGAQGEP